MPKSHKKGVITIAFDDAYRDTYKHAIRYLDKRNIKSTVAVPSAFIGKTFENRPVLGLKELKSMAKRGHEIASHTVRHPNLLRLSSKDKNEVISEMAESRKELEGLLHNKVDSFVFPYINKNQSKFLRAGTRPYYKSARITANSPCFSKLPLKDPYSIPGFAITKNHSLSYLNRQVGYAQKNNLWLIEVFHLVGRKNTRSARRPKPYRFFTHIDDFKKHIDYILSKDMMTLTQNDVVRRYGHGI
jgi:peptidoglycan/xylan/chitin deacetylase (PgdA/CDA1 family)